jgi:threonylcarbamoyladenosine tRNA methylthiotransferase MtaB
VPEPEKDRRSALLRALAARQSELFRRRHLGATLPVLWEEQHDGLWSGLTDNYVRVYSRDECLTANTLTPVRLVELCDDGVFGAPC